MNRRFHEFSSSTALIAFALAGCSLALEGQQPSMPNTDAQREAMRKLAFLVGRWSGPAMISRAPGDRIRLTQTENVQYKLDGLVLLIEGQSTGADGKSQFQALATVAYDDASHSYRFRAYNGGHYVEKELAVLSDGFSWGFDAGTAKFQNTMHLTAKGEWHETSAVTYGSAPPDQIMDMLLVHQR